MNALFTKANILQKLAIIYHRALNIINGHAALWAMKRQTKAISLFAKQLLLKKVRLADMSEIQLIGFMERLEKHDFIKDRGGESVSAKLPP